jgi:hypothetical protein
MASDYDKMKDDLRRQALAEEEERINSTAGSLKRTRTPGLPSRQAARELESRMAGGMERAREEARAGEAEASEPARLSRQYEKK